MHIMITSKWQVHEPILSGCLKEEIASNMIDQKEVCIHLFTVVLDSVLISIDQGKGKFYFPK